MAQVEIEFFPAKNGDCFLIGFDSIHYILIDGGYTETYKLHLRPRLVELAASGKCIDLCIVTHIDKDHILGILELFRENGDATSPKIIEIKEVWHNSYSHLPTNNDEKGNALTVNDAKVLECIVERGHALLSRAKADGKISGKQGSSLASLLLSNNYNWNEHFGGKAVCIENKRTIDLPFKAQLHLLGPKQIRLAKLRKRWKKEIKGLGFSNSDLDSNQFIDAFEFLMLSEKRRVIPAKEKAISADKIDIQKIIADARFEEDDRESNGSSIAFIVEYQGIRLLFPGDAFPSDILAAVEDIYGNDQIPEFDAFKVSHHGSLGNSGPDLTVGIKSNRFLFSTDGSTHSHPHLETLAWLAISHPGFEKDFIFNYPLALLREIDQEQLRHDYQVSLHIGTGTTIKQITIEK